MYEKLKNEITKQGLSVGKVAMRSEISPSDLYTVLGGKKPMYKGWKQRISKTLNVSEKELFDD